VFVGAATLASCVASAPGSSAPQGTREVRAPIVRVALRVAESLPPQYFADLVSALPDGCTRFARAEVRRGGRTVFVDVFNHVPSDGTTLCTMIYAEQESAVPLGSDFESGASYTLDVNGTRQPFVAQ
jgi:hypothetical protein